MKRTRLLRPHLLHKNPCRKVQQITPLRLIQNNPIKVLDPKVFIVDGALANVLQRRLLDLRVVAVEGRKAPVQNIQFLVLVYQPFVFGTAHLFRRLSFEMSLVKRQRGQPGDVGEVQ